MLRDFENLDEQTIDNRIFIFGSKCERESISEGLLGSSRLPRWILTSHLDRDEHIIIFQYEILNLTN